MRMSADDWKVMLEDLAARRARDDVRARIAANDPLFDPGSEYFALPPEAAALEPLAAD